MRRAEEALENGDLDGAVDQQAQAMDALRQGIRDVNRAQRSENSDVQQGNSDQETGQGRDPLGRPQGAMDPRVQQRRVAMAKTQKHRPPNC